MCTCVHAPTWKQRAAQFDVASALPTAKGDGSGHRTQDTGRIVKPEDASLVVAITVKLWEVLWFAVVTGRTLLPFPMHVHTCLCV